MSSYVANWKEVLATSNLSEGKPVDFVSRWLILTRASVFPMTLTSGLIGGLLVQVSGWRAELVGHLIDELLAGRKSIRIEDPLSEHPLAFDPVGGEDTLLEED